MLAPALGEAVRIGVDEGAHGDRARVGGVFDRAGVARSDAERADLRHEVGVDVDLGLAARPAAEQCQVGLADEGLIAAGALEEARPGVRRHRHLLAAAGSEEEGAEDDCEPVSRAAAPHDSTPRMLRVTSAAASSSVPAVRTSETAKASWANGQMPRASRAAIRFSLGWA